MPFVKQVDAVDVDSVVLSIAEQHFLLSSVPSKARFSPLAAHSANSGNKDRRNGTAAAESTPMTGTARIGIT